MPVRDQLPLGDRRGLLRVELEGNTMRRDQGRYREWCIGIFMSLRRLMCSCVDTDDETEVRAEYNSGYSGEVLIVRETALFTSTFFAGRQSTSYNFPELESIPETAEPTEIED